MSMCVMGGSYRLDWTDAYGIRKAHLCRFQEGFVKRELTKGSDLCWMWGHPPEDWGQDVTKWKGRWGELASGRDWWDRNILQHHGFYHSSQDGKSWGDAEEPMGSGVPWLTQLQGATSGHLPSTLSLAQPYSPAWSCLSG